jgi:hypothetical protein
MTEPRKPRFLYGVDGLDVVELPADRRRGIADQGDPPMSEEAAAETEATSSPILKTIEDIVETITNTQTPQASAGVLLDWTIAAIRSAIRLGGFSATADAIGALAAGLEQHKDALSEAVAANP